MGQQHNYENVRAAFVEATMKAWGAFAIQHGLREPEALALEQLSTSLSVTLDEVLWFGLDAWPPGAEDNSD